MRIFAVVALASAALLAAPAPAHAEETWRVASLNWTWSDSFLNDVEAAGPHDLWAGGGQGKKVITIPGDLLRPPITIVNVPAKPILQHWNGTAWTNFSPPEMPGEGQITNIEAVGPDDVWAAGFLGGNSLNHYLSHWDGTSWTRVTPPPDVLPNNSMVAAGGVLWTAGNAGVWSMRGGQWTEHRGHGGWPYPTATGVYALNNLQVSFYDGTSWTGIPEPPGDAGKLATSDGGLWASARTSTDLHRWNGTAWESVPLPDGYSAGATRSLADAGGPLLTVSAAGERRQFRWTGTGWTLFTGHAAAYPHTVTATSGGAFYALNPPSRHTGTAWEALPLQGAYGKVTAIPGSPHAVFWGGGPYGGLAITTNAP
ncbi:hypothetical protein [Actinocorallia longicatena]|uniref:Uncharacterized protein n=1 Tax=Actinocorallia longicatena TaxID=111803 RepID=A0ABP6Q828_9ACTN